MLPEKASRIIGGKAVNSAVHGDGNRFAVTLPHTKRRLQIDLIMQTVLLAQMLKGGNHVMRAVEMTGGTDADSNFYHIIYHAFPKEQLPFPFIPAIHPDGALLAA